MQAPVAAMSGGVVTSQSPPFTLPIRYMMLGVIGFGLFALDLLAQSLHLGGSSAFQPGVVALTHLLTLGSLLAFVMGAVYQLSTVAFLIPIYAVKAARWNFWLYTASIAGLICAMALWWTAGLMIFGTGATLSIYVYCAIVIISVAKTKVRGAMQGFVLSAHAYLALAITVAWLLILALTTPTGLAKVEPELLLTHIVLALGGFFTFLVMGFSFKLLPMFTLAHGFPTWRQKWTLLATHAALWVLIAGGWSHVRLLLWVGGALGIAGFISQGFDLRGILGHRLRKKTEPPMQAVVWAAGGGALGLCLLLVQLGLAKGLSGWQGVVTFYLLGWITLTVMGYAYKIVPFLVWSKRYSHNAGKGKTPLIAELINLHQSRFVLVCFGAGVVVLTGSTLGRVSVGAMIGCLLVAIAILAFCAAMFKVIDPKMVRKELVERD